MVPPPGEVTALLRAAGVAERDARSRADVGRGPPARSSSSASTLELPREPMSPGRARAEVREALAGRLERGGRANGRAAHLGAGHQRGRAPRRLRAHADRLRITVYEDGVRVEVEDAGEGFDPAWPHAPAAEPRGGGRGCSWSTRSRPTGARRHTETERDPRFCVWFESRAGTASRPPCRLRRPELAALALAEPPSAGQALGFEVGARACGSASMELELGTRRGRGSAAGGCGGCSPAAIDGL